MEGLGFFKEKIFAEPSSATAYLVLGGREEQIDTFYHFTYILENRKSPNFSVMNKRASYVSDGKSLVVGQIGVHFTSPLYLPHLYFKLLEGESKPETSTDTKKNDVKKLLGEISEDINKLYEAFGEGTGISDPALLLMAQTTPAERAQLVDLWNAIYLGEKKEEVNTHQQMYGFSIVDLDTTGLSMEIRFNNTISDCSVLRLDDVHFNKITLNFSVDANVPLIEVYSFFAKI